MNPTIENKKLLSCLPMRLRNDIKLSFHLFDRAHSTYEDLIVLIEYTKEINVSAIVFSYFHIKVEQCGSCLFITYNTYARLFTTVNV